MARDLAKAARHPVVEERPVGSHRERPDIRALGRSALCSVATTIAARGMSKSILFQRHAALLVTNNALCLMSGLVSGI